MYLEINLKKQEQDIANKWAFVLQLLRSLEFVESVTVEGEKATPTNKIAELLLNGPIMTHEEEEFYQQKKQHFNKWN